MEVVALYEKGFQNYICCPYSDFACECWQNVILIGDTAVILLYLLRVLYWPVFAVNYCRYTIISDKCIKVSVWHFRHGRNVCTQFHSGHTITDGELYWDKSVRLGEMWVLAFDCYIRLVCFSLVIRLGFIVNVLGLILTVATVFFFEIGLYKSIMMMMIMMIFSLATCLFISVPCVFLWFEVVTSPGLEKNLDF